MHWLTEFRANYRNKDGSTGISRKELARMVRKPGTASRPESEIGCSEALIGILEGGGITHPLIADRIADVTGATSAQRDILVHKMHHGTYRPQKAQKREPRKNLAPTDPDYKPVNARQVVRIDVLLQAKRFASIREAAAAEGCNAETVRVRCDRALTVKQKELMVRDHTWRYADEWDSMSQDQRLEDMIQSGLYS